MKEIARKPSDKRCSAGDGPTPAGRTRRSRRAEQARKQAPARPCAPERARPDHCSAEEHAMDRALRAYEVIDLSRALDREVRKLLLAAERAPRKRRAGKR